MNILVTSAGRRTSLVLAFQEAGRPYGVKVLAADLDPLAPAFACADAAFRVPKVADPAYLPTLLRIAREQAVGLVVPTIDPELGGLAEVAQDFLAEGIAVMVSTPGFVAICRDKWKTFRTFQAEGIAVPASWLPNRLDTLPEELFLKPREGSASQNAFPCRRVDLDRMLPLVPNPIVQEWLDGPEVTMDAMLDFQGRPLHYVARERIRTLAGESIQGVTLDKPDLDGWVERVLVACARLGARGVITLQAFLTERGPVLTEINPRFGGGFPLARAAGGDYPAWLLALLRGEAVPPRLGQYRRGLYMTRTSTEVFMDTLPWPLEAAQAVREPGNSPVKSAPNGEK